MKWAVSGIALVVSAAMVSGCTGARSARPAVNRLRSSAERPHAADSLSASLDGLAFVRDGKLYRVSGAVATEIGRDGRRKLGVVSAGGNGLLVTEQSGEGADVVLVHGADPRSMRTLVHVDSASGLSGVRMDARRGTLYRALDGDPTPRLFVSPVARASQATAVVLGGSFSGEFDLVVRPVRVVYTSATQDPAAVYVSGGAGPRVVTAKLATAFAPAVSGNGRLMCLTGARRAGDPIAIWVVDVDGSGLRRLDATAGFAPTHPVFSPDGAWIAYRGHDGALHTVRPDGTGERTLPFSADDVTIAW